MTSVKNAEKISFERLAKIVGRHFFDRFADKTDSGVIYQNIHAAENALGFVKHHPDLRFASHIADFAVNVPVRDSFSSARLRSDLSRAQTKTFAPAFIRASAMLKPMPFVRRL